MLDVLYFVRVGILVHSNIYALISFLLLLSFKDALTYDRLVSVSTSHLSAESVKYLDFDLFLVYGIILQTYTFRLDKPEKTR